MSNQTQTFTIRAVETIDNQTRAVPYVYVIARQGSRYITSAITDDSGEAQLTLPHGSYSLWIKANHFKTVSMDITVPVPSSPVTVTLQRATQDVIIRTVTIPGHKRIPDARVEIYRGETLVASGTTNQEGEASFDLELGFTYRVTVRHPSIGLANKTFDVPYYNPITDNNVLLVEMPNYITLIVVDEEGKDLDGVLVSVEGPNNIQVTRYTENGTVRIGIWDFGQYRVTLSHNKRRIVRMYNYSISHTWDIVDTIVISPVKLSVVVRDPQGNPVRGALVKLIKDGNVIRQGNTT